MPGQTQPRQANVDNIALQTLVAAAVGVTGADQSNPYAKGITVVVDITAVAGTATPSLTVTIEGKDPVSGKYYTLLTSAALTAIGTTVLRVYPALTAAANSIANLPLPKTFRIKTVIAGTTPAITATIGASLHA